MSKIRASARGQECQVRIPYVCNFDSTTTCWAHCNGSAAGKGIGQKAIDILGAYCCSACHDVYDRRAKLPKGLSREDVELYFADGHYRSVRILEEKGLVRVA